MLSREYARKTLRRSFRATGRAFFAIGSMLHCNMFKRGGDAGLAFDNRKERS
jgi:hypothetical protein